MHDYVGDLFVDVMTISYVFILNCMIYCLFRNRALQVGIRAWLVLSGPKPGELPVVFEWYVELPSIFVVLFY